MLESSSTTRTRIALLVLLALSLIIFALQAIVVRPNLWPAGAGITLSGDTLFASLAEPVALPRIRPPYLNEVTGNPIFVTRVDPLSAAAAQGLMVGTAVYPAADAGTALRLWREAYLRGPIAEVRLTDSERQRSFAWMPRAVWTLDAEARSFWLRRHLGPLMQMGGFLAGALILVMLGSRGVTATLMTLALIATAIANAGPLFGAEFLVPFLGEVLLALGWMVTPFSFPVIALAVLHFPSKARLLHRYPWIYGVLVALPAPMFVISVAATAFLLGVDTAAGPLAWFARNGWLFDTSFAVALGANLVIVVEGIYRYRTTLDANERRRIQIVVYTGVPAVFAYAVKAGVPLVASIAGVHFEWPLPVEALLQIIVLLPAFALPYAVAVKHVFSPRTVLRRGLQYALAKRTLSVLIVLPIAVLGVSLVTNREQPLGDIVLGQPLFYAISLGLAGLGFKYREQAQRSLDRRFFRAEYDAREILVSLANRVPYEDNPAQLVALVLSQIDNALHPEWVAVLAGEEARLDVVSALRRDLTPIPRDSGLATLLRWSDEPLEIFVDDERSPAARLPTADQTWLKASGVSLLVPMFAGTGEGRGLIGVIGLGQKRSEEPYTREDRKLLSGIAAQMSVALDLSRLRRRASTAGSEYRTPTLTPTMVGGSAMSALPALMMCPACRRCYAPGLEALDGLAGREGFEGSEGPSRGLCPADANVLQPVIGMVPIVDGKYRIDALVGRGSMGAVFRARDRRLDRDVAIKIVRGDLVGDPESRARFQREAQIVARLQHPAIVTVFDYGNLPDGAAFLVMEYVRGEDLRHLLNREKSLPAARAIPLISGIASGVDAAHRAGVLHRDLKPENILLSENGSGPKVLDFGIAKMTDAAVQNGNADMATRAGTIVGTPAYMAPEQLRGDRVDGRADVYSLAVLAYETLTGRLPFGEGSFIDIGIKQADGRVAFEGMPSALAQTLQQALSLNREERPGTAIAFADALQRLL